MWLPPLKHLHVAEYAHSSARFHLDMKLYWYFDTRKMSLLTRSVGCHGNKTAGEFASHEIQLILSAEKQVLREMKPLTSVLSKWVPRNNVSALNFRVEQVSALSFRESKWVLKNCLWGREANLISQEHFFQLRISCWDFFLICQRTSWEYVVWIIIIRFRISWFSRLIYLSTDYVISLHLDVQVMEAK